MMMYNRQVLVAFLLASIKQGAGQPNACTTRKKCNECVARDCDKDSECNAGLLCADAHKAELQALGLDPRKAYCGANVGDWNWELCYDPKKLPRDCKPTDQCSLCEARDCDTDADCVPGLLCADAHKAELVALGLDPRKADCGANVGAWNWELCYKPPGCKDDADCDNGNVCDGWETCDVATGECVSGTALYCDDHNACTSDACDKVNGCSNTPSVTCPEGEACDPSDGTCKDVEELRPCIAVIDESDNFSDGHIDALWATFRANFPDRPFCLLKPDLGARLYLPTNPDFLTDPKSTFVVVNRDNGDPLLASDWLGACGYTDLASTAIEFVALFVDTSGSMTLSTVQESYEKFKSDIQLAGLTFCEVQNGNEDWITPFDTLLGEVGGGGSCVIPP